MKNVQMLRAKTYHMAAKVNGQGGVSALCFSAPRAIDLSRALWTIVPTSVTCAKCKALMKQRAAASITSVEQVGNTMTIRSTLPASSAAVPGVALGDTVALVKKAGDLGVDLS